MAIKLSDNIYWVGAVDYDIRDFHGYRTPYGTSYNAYLVIDEKVTLIDTVKADFSHVLIDNISEIIDPKEIDYIITNHVEPDHSGALPDVLEVTETPVIITSPMGDKVLKAYYKKDWNVNIVKTGDSLSTGEYSFNFLQTPMVHWPDSMVTYLPEEKFLFSNDAFGQHLASEERFEDEIGAERVLERAKDYYANIIFPLGAQVRKILTEVSKLDISLIAPSHGVMWRKDISTIVSKYTDWANNKTNDDEGVIVYDTMWGSTEILAQRIGDEFREKGIKVKILSLKEHHISEVINQLLTAKYICVGSSTLNRNILPNVAAFLTYMKGLAPKDRIGMAFGSYGWSGESVDIVEDTLRSCGFDIIDKLKVQYKPD